MLWQELSALPLSHKPGTQPARSVLDRLADNVRRTLEAINQNEEFIKRTLAVMMTLG